MAKGRKDREGQEAVQNHETIKTRIDELTRLHRRSKEASEEFSEAIKKAAEDSGFLATVVRRFVVARSGERFLEKQRENQQLELLFTELGE